MTTILSILGDCDLPSIIEVNFSASNRWRRLDEYQSKPIPVMGLSTAIAQVNKVCGDHKVTDPVFSLRVVHAHTGEHLWPPK